ncbi:DUF1753-domain-containing protein [Teratosphaeria nubilosa]|uniref:DUF1753-domain-containing protein n=1 Tax=Teratosphaeria nubilosa TaxID=161662 RepID=A0A6G1LIH9_9PEZI|nr:DUF1753-domain-containing protein [Teratosphaeria nubilosa]
MAPALRFPRPRTLLHLVPLRTAAEFIVFTLAINKLTGLYGILALLTGYHLNPLQLSHYLYSLLVLGLVCWLSPAIRVRGDGAGVLKVVGLAWLYIADTIINSIYTTLFGLGWFIILAQHLNDTVGDGKLKVPGGDTMKDTAGFTDPEHPGVSHVEVVATPAAGALSGQQAVAYASTTSQLSSTLFAEGSLASLIVLSLLWLVRIYFCLVILSFARSTVRSYIAQNSSSTYAQTEDATMAEHPFREGRDEGAGWMGKLGRAMLMFPTKRYWLGKDESEDEWVRQRMETRFASGRRDLRIKTGKGAGERERRARSGTGPSPPIALAKLPK